MPKTGLKGMRSTEGRTMSRRTAPGKDTPASVHDGGGGSRSKSSGLGSRKAIVKAYHGRTTHTSPAKAPKS